MQTGLKKEQLPEPTRKKAVKLSDPEIVSECDSHNQGQCYFQL